jgi:hypothetical protein
MEEKGIDEMLETLRTARHVTVDEPTLWSIFARAFPRRPSGPEERRWLRLMLTHAHAAHVIELPGIKSRRWDRSGVPALPTAVSVVRPVAVPVDESWRRLPWHPALQWVPALKRQAGLDVTFLRGVHEGLVRDAFAEIVPIRHRSLQLTGDEKRLEKLMYGSLFQPGRLTTKLLGCEPELPPLSWVTVGRSPRVLVFENAGPFDLATRLLREMEQPPYGTVAYGAGLSFITSVARLARLQVLPSEIAYAGDLDRNGLRIPVLAEPSAIEVGLPAPTPASGIHEAMLEGAAAFGQADGWPARKGDGADDRRPDDHSTPDDPAITARGGSARDTGRDVGDETLLAFLPTPLRTQVRSIWTAGRRVPEEVLAPEALRLLFGFGP